MKKVLLSALLLCSTTVYAQTVPPANTGADVINSSQLQKMKQVELEKKLLKKESDEKIKPIEQNDVQKGEVQEASFILKKVNFTGNTVYSDEKLEEYMQPILGKKVTINQVKEITLILTNLYRTNGYITSMVYIPPQTINNGEIEIKVMEGKIGQIDITGNKWAKTNYLKNHKLGLNDIKEDKVFNVTNLKTSLSEINSENYLKGKIQLQRGEKPETTDIKLQVEDRVPLGVQVTWDNQGREYIGYQRAGITVSDNNVLGIGDRLSTTTTLGRGIVGSSTMYSVPVGKYGTEFQIGYSHTGVDLREEYKPLDINSSSNILTAGLFHPIFRNDKYKVTGDVNFDMTDVHTTMMDRFNLTRHQLRVLRAGVTGIRNGNRGRWISRLQVSTGIPFMGGKRSGNNAFGCSKFVKLNGNITRVQLLPYEAYGIFKLSGQYANRALLGSEQMQIGGMYTVRGFHEGVLLGDTGYNFSAELRRPMPYLPEYVKIPYWVDKTYKLSLDRHVYLAGFYDLGYAKQIYQGLDTTYRNFLQSVGFGLRVKLTEYVNANFDWGVPLGRDRYAKQEAMKFHFSLTTEIL